MNVPSKYLTMASFHRYYSGEAVVPVLTLFIGGNHEASNHLQELYYGGWVAPNIYYLGAAGVVRVGGVRIAGLSGIFNGRHYKWVYIRGRRGVMSQRFFPPSFDFCCVTHASSLHQARPPRGAALLVGHHPERVPRAGAGGVQARAAPGGAPGRDALARLAPRGLPPRGPPAPLAGQTLLPACMGGSRWRWCLRNLVQCA